MMKIGCGTVNFRRYSLQEALERISKAYLLLNLIIGTTLHPGKKDERKSTKIRRFAKGDISARYNIQILQFNQRK